MYNLNADKNTVYIAIQDTLYVCMYVVLHCPFLSTFTSVTERRRKEHTLKTKFKGIISPHGKRSSVKIKTCHLGTLQSSNGSKESGDERERVLPLFESIFLPFIKEICLRTAQIHYLWTTIPILLLNGAFFAKICIWNSRPSTNYTSPLKAEGF